MSRLVCVVLAMIAAAFVLAGGSSQTGSVTEKRFPPLKVPPGFEAKLFACDPLIEYPSAIAIGPRRGTLFVAIDYMTGLGTQIIRRDEIRLIQDTDGDGYADAATVFAGGFNSIQGLAYDRGTVFVMHAPFLTALCDTDGDGKADERKDLLTGLGLPPEKNAVRLHCANGVVPGHDGWLYLALGDHGCDVQRPEGDRLVLEGGGILRCRPDGRDLHVFAIGLRNIYDVALDDELNVFVRDNENDGGEYMIRLCHSFFGADHGYPYLYYERPQEALAPLADLGLGSSAGGACYLETAFPREFRGNLFWCEWGRAVMRSQPQPSPPTPLAEGEGQGVRGFAALKEIEFASGAANDPYGFKPTDLVVDRDGSLLIADWCDGQRPKRGRGRIYRVSASLQDKQPVKTTTRPATIEDWLIELDSPSYHVRAEAQHLLQRAGKPAIARVQQALREKRLGVHGRLHAVWIMADGLGGEAESSLLSLAIADSDPRVRAQAVRALADLADPVLTEHKLQTGPGSSELAVRLANLPLDDARVSLEVVIALGRLRWPAAPRWLEENLSSLLGQERTVDAHPALSHAAMQTLRLSRNWSAVLKLLDRPGSEPVRVIAPRALAHQYQPLIADDLIQRLSSKRDSDRRRLYADLLTCIYKKPGPWTYWGYRPPPRPTNSVAWEKTEAIAQALDRVLSDADFAIRHAVLLRMQREKIPVRLETLAAWAGADFDAARTQDVLQAVKQHAAADSRNLLAELVANSKHADANRVRALTMLSAGLDSESELVLLKLTGQLNDGPILANVLDEIGRRPGLSAESLLIEKTSSLEPLVRGAALGALANRKAVKAAELTTKLLEDSDLHVRRAAVTAAGKLAMGSAADRVLDLAKHPCLRQACLETLRKLGDGRAIPIAVAALNHPETQSAALDYLEALGGAAQADELADLARRHPAADILGPVVRMLRRWAAKEAPVQQLLGQIQGETGVLLDWSMVAPVSSDEMASLRLKFAGADKALLNARELPGGMDGRIDFKEPLSSSRLLFTDVTLPAATNVQFLSAGNSVFRFWVDGRLLYERRESRAFQPDSDRFEANLEKGTQRLWVELEPAKGTTSFQARFRRKASDVAHEQLVQLALSKAGSAERGRKVFFDVAKSQCLKCHRFGDQGERIGPDLAGVGKRFARIHLIESILEPSRSMPPGFQTHYIELKDGRALTGLPLAETATALVLADKEGKRSEVPLAQIDSRRPHPLSIMPDGLERQLSADEFVDLIAFLAGQK